MDILEKALKKLVGKDILLVQMDGTGFKGILEEYDDDALVLSEVSEIDPETLTWCAPKVSMINGPAGVKEKTGEIAKLNRAIFLTSHIMRIWEWSPEKVEKAQKFVIRQKSQDSA